MTTASVALRAAIVAALGADAPLTSLLGGAKIYNQPPASAAFPYVTLGESRVSDYSTGDAAGEEHAVTLHGWSRQGGHRQAHAIAGALFHAVWTGEPQVVNGLVNLSALIMAYMAARFGVLGVYVSGRSKEKRAAAGKPDAGAGLVGEFVKSLARRR